MNDIIIKVNTSTGEAFKTNDFVGNYNQNLQNKLKFEMSEKIVGVAWLEYEISNHKYYTEMQEYENGYYIDIKSALLVSPQLKVDLLITESETPSGVPKFVSTIVTLKVNNTINAEVEEPEQYPTWFELASDKILQMENLNINVEKVDKVTTITFTDKYGVEHISDVLDGEKGDIGDSGLVVFHIENGHLIATSEAPQRLTSYSLDEDGHLYLTIEEV